MGNASIRSMRRLSMRKASRKAAAFSASLPSTAAGSGMPQCALVGRPGQTGQVFAAALSQTVKMRSNSGPSANSLQLLEE